MSTGDAITPHAVQYQFSEIFDDEKSYELWAYNIETVMAEKVETILRRGVFNTRPRDFYDAYILATTQKFDKGVFAEALSATATQLVRLRMCLPFCTTSRAARNSKPCGKSTASSLPMPPTLRTARSWMC